MSESNLDDDDDSFPVFHIDNATPELIAAVINHDLGTASNKSGENLAGGFKLSVTVSKKQMQQGAMTELLKHLKRGTTTRDENGSSCKSSAQSIAVKGDGSGNARMESTTGSIALAAEPVSAHVSAPSLSSSKPGNGSTASAKGSKIKRAHDPGNSREGSKNTAASNATSGAETTLQRVENKPTGGSSASSKHIEGNPPLPVEDSSKKDTGGASAPSKHVEGKSPLAVEDSSKKNTSSSSTSSKNVQVKPPLPVQGSSKKNKTTDLHDAAAKNDLKRVIKLLHARADVNAKDENGRLPLELATMSEVWRAFASRMPPPACKLLEAATQGDAIAMRLLLAKGADAQTKDFEGLNALHAAAYAGHLEAVTVLLDHSGQKFVEIRTSKAANGIATSKGWFLQRFGQGGLTPLHVASAVDCPLIVNLLAQRGANLDAQTTTDCETALHIAASLSSHGCIKALITHGASTLTRTKWEQTPLHLAAETGNETICKMLMKADAGAINAKDAWGNTPVHIIMQVSKQRKALEMIRVMVYMGTDLSLRNNLEQSVLDVARGLKWTFAQALPEHQNHTKTFPEVEENKKILPHKTTEVSAFFQIYFKIPKAAPASMTQAIPLPDKGTFTLFKLTHVTADLIAAILKLLHDHLGPDFAARPDGVADTGSGEFVLSIAVPKRTGQHGAMMTLMSLLMQRAVGGNGNGGKSCGEAGAAESSKAHDFTTDMSPVCTEKTDAAAVTLKALNQVQHWRDIANNDNESGANKAAASLSASKAGNALQNILPSPSSQKDLDLSAATTVSNIVDPQELSNLHIPAARNDVKAVRELLTGGADPYMKDSNGCLPIDLAKSPPVWKVFSEWMSYPTSYTIWDAVKDGDAAAVKIFLSKRNQFDVHMIHMTKNEGFSLVHLAAKLGHEDVLLVLIDFGGPLLTNLLLPGAIDVVGDEKKEGYTPLHMAAAYNHTHIVNALVKRGVFLEYRTVDTDLEGFTPLHIAAKFGSEESLRSLISNGAHLDAKTGLGLKSALHIAAERGHDGVCRILIEAAADRNRTIITAKDAWGRTPLYAAVEAKNEAICQILVNSDRSAIGMKDQIGLTPLHVAADYVYEDICKMLLEADPTVINSKDNNGNTPLHILIQSTRPGQKVDVAKLLVSMGSDVKAKNKRGLIPLDIARERGLLDICVSTMLEWV
ncbi:hypothetical protein HDU96_002983 [Phlyctochytrium bullatum]|nr:hypothetical protein HDU96_002983 [Phlyctochytrium bullatum]